MPDAAAAVAAARRSAGPVALKLDAVGARPQERRGWRGARPRRRRRGLRRGPRDARRGAPARPDGPRPARRADGRARARADRRACAATRCSVRPSWSASAASSPRCSTTSPSGSPRSRRGRRCRCSTTCAAGGSSTASAAGPASTGRRSPAMLVALGRLGLERPDLLEVDLNPVIASPIGRARGRRAGRARGGDADAAREPDAPLVLTTTDAVGRPADAEPAGQAQRPVRPARRGAGRGPRRGGRRPATSGSSCSRAPDGPSRPATT